MSCKTISCVLGAAGFAASAALLAANVAPAQAGGLPEDDGSLKDTGYYEPAPVWTGLYVGVHGGYATGEWDGRVKSTSTAPGKYEDTAGLADPTRTIDGDGFLGGVQVGYNYQSGRLVLGTEADISWTNFDGSGTFATEPDYLETIFVKKHEMELDYFGTARARLGYAGNGWMPYVTGGLAWGETSGDLTVTYENNPRLVGKASKASVDETHVGWTAGLGVEALLSDGWSVKGEWLYVDLGEEDYLFKGKAFTGDDFETDSYESDLDFHTFRVGLNYKLWGGERALEPSYK